MTLLSGKIKAYHNKLVDSLNLLVLRFCADRLRIVLINEFPKCGASWLRSLLIDCLSREGHNYGNLNESGLMTTVRYGSIIQRHWLKKVNTYKTIVLIRDPRDIFNSFYFYEIYFRDSDIVKRNIGYNESDGDHINIYKYLSWKLEQPDVSTPGFSIQQFWNLFKNDQSVLLVKYEDLNRDTLNELNRILIFVGNPNLDREKLVGIIKNRELKKRHLSQKDEKKQFNRKGVVGDWVNNFSLETKALVKSRLGGLLIDMGYEHDLNW